VPPVSLNAEKLLPAKQLMGENFKVDADVKNDGLINLCTLNTDYGRFKIESAAGPRIRVDKLNALVAMEKLERSDVFKDAAVGTVKATGDGINLSAARNSGSLAASTRWRGKHSRSVVGKLSRMPRIS
jgi:hypothetical protein